MKQKQLVIGPKTKGQAMTPPQCAAAVNSTQPQCSQAGWRDGECVLIAWHRSIGGNSNKNVLKKQAIAKIRSQRYPRLATLPNFYTAILIYCYTAIILNCYTVILLYCCTCTGSLWFLAVARYESIFIHNITLSRYQHFKEIQVKRYDTLGTWYKAG